MDMGKPVIVGASGTSGFREQVIPFGPNICGFHINPNDPSDVAKFAIMLLKDSQLRASMGQNARRRVLESFTWDIAASNTLRVYEEAIEMYNKKKRALYESVCKVPPP
jgi:glycosyltransferase involved in cell wall biosynthesis